VSHFTNEAVPQACFFGGRPDPNVFLTFRISVKTLSLAPATSSSSLFRSEEEEEEEEEEAAAASTKTVARFTTTVASVIAAPSLAFSVPPFPVSVLSFFFVLSSLPGAVVFLFELLVLELAVTDADSPTW
jgi:hypothetical protein